MIKTVISVTEAARNFADCVNRAHYQNVTYVLLKNGVPVARLVPDGQKEQKVCSGRDLANVLRSTSPHLDNRKSALPFRQESTAPMVTRNQRDCGNRVEYITSQCLPQSLCNQKGEGKEPWI